MSSAGHDYGLGLTNIDKKTGIRYGLIHFTELAGWVIEEATPIYPEELEIECPECGYGFMTRSNDQQTCPCEECQHEFTDNPWEDQDTCGWDYSPNDADYKAEAFGDNGDIFVSLSSYCTYAAFCSPCAPGAVSLNRWLPPTEGVKGYCPGHDWFEGGVAPYPVYSVATNELVAPEQTA